VADKGEPRQWSARLPSPARGRRMWGEKNKK